MRAAERDRDRRALYAFDTRLKRMSVLGRDALYTKGAVESVLPLCDEVLGPDGAPVALSAAVRAGLSAVVDRYAAAGLRVLAVASRDWDGQRSGDRAEVERELVLLGLVAMADPPRAGVADAVAAAHRAGIRVHVITGDYGPTAAEIARQVGIGGVGRRIVTGEQLDRMSEAELDAVLAGPDEVASPARPRRASCGSARRCGPPVRSWR